MYEAMQTLTISMVASIAFQFARWLNHSLGIEWAIAFLFISVIILGGIYGYQNQPEIMSVVTRIFKKVP